MMSLCPEFKDLMPEEAQHSLPYSSKVISTIVELAYTGATTTDEDILEEQLKMAKHFGIDPLTKICSDFIIATLTMGNWNQRYRLGQRFLCKHAMEQVMRFICTNLANLDNAAELLTVEDLEAVLKREDVNCTT